MTLIKSISGIRGTIGGKPGDGLSPLDIVKFTTGYAAWVKKQHPTTRCRVVLGRDARISGEMVNQIVAGTLSGMGIDVINLGLATTPTVEIAVTREKAQGGIILTASHNPKQWNALKLLNEHGEFLSDKDGREVLEIAEKGETIYAGVDDLGKVIVAPDYNAIHVQDVLSLDLVDVEAIRAAGFRVAIDCVNSVGGIILPSLLKALGVKDVIELYCTPDGQFPHNPEPLPEHLTEISKVVRDNKAHLGFVVDPDVDRLAIVCEDGSMFGEEYTLVAVADHVLKHKPGNTVSNLSSTRALSDVTRARGGEYFASAVGEVNVVTAMKANNSVIGGEGNGGVIYPPAHYGRDALVGIALFLTHLAKSGQTCSGLKASYPSYHISKNKLQLQEGTDVDGILITMKRKYKDAQVNDVDGLKIDFEEGWVHLRKSNTEPIIRVYSEAANSAKAEEMASTVIQEIQELI
jgi:phosphomannomutase